MLCRKFELIPTSIFRVMTIYMYVLQVLPLFILPLYSTDCPTPPVVSKESTPSSWFEDLLSDEAEDDIDSSGKILFLLELLEETKKVHEKVLVFSQSLLLLDQIEYLLQQRDFMEGIDYFRLDGSTKASHRTELMKKFNRKNNERLVYHI